MLDRDWPNGTALVSLTSYLATKLPVKLVSYRLAHPNFTAYCTSPVVISNVLRQCAVARCSAGPQ